MNINLKSHFMFYFLGMDISYNLITGFNSTYKFPKCSNYLIDIPPLICYTLDSNPDFHLFHNMLCLCPLNAAVIFYSAIICSFSYLMHNNGRPNKFSGVVLCSLQFTAHFHPECHPKP